MTKIPKLEINNIPQMLPEQAIIETLELVVDKLNLQLSDKILEISFVDQAEMAKINLEYRHIAASTDVLSFPQASQPHPESLFGTILISPIDAAEREEDMTDLIKHGMLHLAGYDHETDPDEWAIAAKKINHRMGI